MKDSFFLQTKLVFLEKDSSGANKWENPYNKGVKLDKLGILTEKDPQVKKLNDLGRKLCIFANNLSENAKPIDIKADEYGIIKERKLTIKNEGDLVRVSIFEKNSDNSLIRRNYIFNKNTGKYINGQTLEKSDKESDIKIKNDPDPFVLLKILPSIIEGNTNRKNASERILNTKTVSRK